MNYYVYILECADGTYYTGSTNDIEKRLHTHNNLKTGAKYTKTRRPVKLVHEEAYQTKSEALIREHQIKQFTRSQKESLIKGFLQNS